MINHNYKHWHLEFDEENILWLGFDRDQRSVNTISREVLSEFAVILEELGVNEKISGLVIYSRKLKGCIAGADVEQFSQLKDIEIARGFLLQGHAVFDSLEKLAIPTVMLIKGFCLGGGTELALACDYRIAVDDQATKIGLPEILLGIHPGWGGSVRLPKLIGPLAALDMILTGRSQSAQRAKKIGLVDDVVPERHMRRAVRQFVLKKPKKTSAKFWHKLLEWQPIRKLITKFMRREVAKKARPDHYPSPYAVLALWQTHGTYGIDAMKAEIDSLTSIMHNSDTPRQLLRVFFLHERLKSLAKVSQEKFKRVHVIGAGVMGGDIAAWCALQGMIVTLQDRAPKYIAKAMQRAEKLMRKKLKRPRAIQEAMDRLIPDVAGDGIATADVILEAVSEDAKIKMDIFRDIEKRAKLEAILATNTSSIPLDTISVAMAEPQRLVGIHFFNPVAHMQLVEVVAGTKTREDILAQAQAFVGQIERLPLPVLSKPGFLVNRVLMPYLMECMTLLEEGISGPEIDSAAIEFGMPMGPVELADTVGLDICLEVAKNLTTEFGGQVPQKLQQMVANGKLGKKTGEGFYRYRKDKPVKGKVNANDPNKRSEIINRMTLRLLNEAAACLREGVVADADLLDAGMIFGTGFAPFRGGPMEYVRNMGQKHFNERFKKLRSNQGERFAPDIFWQSTAFWTSTGDHREI